MNQKKAIYWFLSTCVLLSLISCSEIGNKEMKEEVELNQLLISEDSLPLGWTFTSSGPGIDWDRSRDSIGQVFFSELYPESLGVGQDVYRQKNNHLAERDYQKSLEAFGSFGDIPDNWKYESKFSEESYFVCHYYPDTNFPICLWGARYNNVVIELRAWLIPEYLTLDDVEKIISEIDEKAGSLIKGEN